MTNKVNQYMHSKYLQTARELTDCFFPVREINIDSIQAPEPRTREEFLQCESQCLITI